MWIQTDANTNTIVPGLTAPDLVQVLFFAPTTEDEGSGDDCCDRSLWLIKSKVSLSFRAKFLCKFKANKMFCGGRAEETVVVVRTDITDLELEFQTPVGYIYKVEVQSNANIYA